MPEGVVGANAFAAQSAALEPGHSLASSLALCLLQCLQLVHLHLPLSSTRQCPLMSGRMTTGGEVGLGSRSGLHRLALVASCLEAPVSLKGGVGRLLAAKVAWPIHRMRPRAFRSRALIAYLIVVGTRCSSTALFAWTSALSLVSRSVLVRRELSLNLALPMSACEVCAGIQTRASEGVSSSAASRSPWTLACFRFSDVAQATPPV